MNNSLSPTPYTKSPPIISIQIFFTNSTYSPIHSINSAKPKTTTSSGNCDCSISFDIRFTNKTGFIDGTLAKPDPSSPNYEPWKQCNAIVLRWMSNSVTETLQNYVLQAETAHKAWEDLRRVFVPCVDFKIYELRQSLATLRQGGDSVGEYFGKLSKAWMELSEFHPVPECKCGGCGCESTKRAKEAREKERRYAFLMGLNKEFDYVRMKIMNKKNPPSVHEAYEMVVHSESIMKWNRG